MTHAEPAPTDRIVREGECKAMTGLSRTRRYELEQLDQFPRRVKLSEHAIGWKLSDLQDWIASRQSSA